MKRKKGRCRGRNKAEKKQGKTEKDGEGVPQLA
jgi:hypothetical protein